MDYECFDYSDKVKNDVLKCAVSLVRISSNMVWLTEVDKTSMNIEADIKKWLGFSLV